MRRISAYAATTSRGTTAEQAHVRSLSVRSTTREISSSEQAQFQIGGIGCLHAALGRPADGIHRLIKVYEVMAL